MNLTGAAKKSIVDFKKSAFLFADSTCNLVVILLFSITASVAFMVASTCAILRFNISFSDLPCNFNTLSCESKADNFSFSTSRFFCEDAFNFFCSSLTPLTASFMLSQFATIAPRAITKRPIPVEPIAALIPLNASMATAFNTLKESFASSIASTPCDNANAPCTFTRVSSSSFDSLPNNACAPCKAAKPPVTPCIAEPSALNFASGLNPSVNAFASPISSRINATFFAALIASVDVSPNCSRIANNSCVASLSCFFKDTNGCLSLSPSAALPVSPSCVLSFSTSFSACFTSSDISPNFFLVSSSFELASANSFLI